VTRFDPEPEADSTAARSSFEKHDRVRHLDFGRGYVVRVMGDNCTVFFLQDGKTRDFKQSKLEPCS
jgi:hypothetical protein